MDRTEMWATAAVIAVVIIALIAVFYIQTPEGEIIKIGFIGPLTGDAAIIGEENLNGIVLAVEELNSGGGINGREIKLIIKDDQLDNKETITQYNQLVSIEGVSYVLTVTYGGFIALANQAEQDNTILINSLDASEEFSGISNNAFAIGIYDESIGYAIADYLNSKGIDETGLLSNLEDPFMILIGNAFKDRFDGEVSEEHYIFDNKDFRTILNKLSSHEYIVLLGWEETGRIVKQAVELGMETKFIGIDTFASEDFRKNTNNNYEGLSFTFWQGSEENEKYNRLISDYSSGFEKNPENVLFVATGYDAMMVLGEVLRSCVHDVNCAVNKLREDINNFEGATGPITIDPDGITRSIQETIHTYLNGEIVAI